ncbi:MAG: site-2 protease family protein [Alphaproteobacteria bacterium]
MQLLIFAVPILVAITFHEAAHGFVAHWLGDDTAKKLGRVTLNPLKHIDFFGTIVVPAMLLLARAPFLFGYAKPVPVNFRGLNSPRRDMVLVAAAGPATNLILALVSAILLKITTVIVGPIGPPSMGVEILAKALIFSIRINLILAVFNMLPLPPLDGGRVAVGLLPNFLAIPLAKLENYGMFILLGLIFLVPFAAGQLGYDINPFATIILPPVEVLMRIITEITGL